MADLLEQRVRETLAQVAEDTAIPACPAMHASADSAHRRQRGLHRVGVVAGCVAALAATGLGAAVATGAVDANLAFWHMHGVETNAAQVLGEFSAPGQRTVRVEMAPADGGLLCQSFRVLPQSDARPPNEGGGCAPREASRFGYGGSEVQWHLSANDDYWLFVRSAGSATSAVVVTGSTRHDLLVRKGWIMGWADADRPATVTGYDSSGNIVGHFRLDPTPPGP